MKKLPPKTESIIRRLLVGIKKVGDHRRIGEIGAAFEPISVEMIGPKIVSIAQFYVQDSDIMWDPMLEILVDDEGCWPLYFEQSMPPVYQRVAKVRDGKLVVLNERGYRDLLCFVVEYCGNLESQHEF